MTVSRLGLLCKTWHKLDLSPTFSEYFLIHGTMWNTIPFSALNPRRPKRYNSAPLHVRQLLCRLPTAGQPFHWQLLGIALKGLLKIQMRNQSHQNLQRAGSDPALWTRAQGDFEGLRIRIQGPRGPMVLEELLLGPVYPVSYGPLSGTGTCLWVTNWGSHIHTPHIWPSTFEIMFVEPWNCGSQLQQLS